MPKIDGNKEFSAITNREFFAAMIMQALCTTGFTVTNYDYVAELSVKGADALVKALNQEAQP